MLERVDTLVWELLNFKYEPTDKIKNIVAIITFNSALSLEAIAIGSGSEQANYEPEQFPAVIHCSNNAILMIFASGEIVCTDLTNRALISLAIAGITEEIEALGIS